jgi:hypothetical protein
MRNRHLLLAATLLLATSLPCLRTAHAAPPPNLLPNGSFEVGASPDSTDPAGWSRDVFEASATLSWDAGVALMGSRSVMIAAPTPNDARWVATVPVQPHRLYALSGWIKTDQVEHSQQSVDAGANLCLMGTWSHTAGVFGTSDWTYVSMIFNSGAQTEVTIGARLGYWAGATTGTAWFDGLRLSLVESGSAAPAWKILVLIYDSTDFTYVDAGGVERHGVAHISAEERARAAREATTFVTQDIPLLTSGIMTPTVTIRYPDHPLARLSPNGGGWWPSPADTAADRDPSFDAVIVIWDPRTIDQRSGEAIWIGSAAGLTPSMGTGQTYMSQIIESTGYGHRNVFKHEWGHSILSYFEAVDSIPQPVVTNHADAGQYVHCPSGAPYVWADETDASPIPNSIYHNTSGFTHDYYSGTVATPDQPARCLGITREAWAAGGPVSHAAVYPYYHQVALSPTDAEQVAAPGDVVRHRLRVINTGNITDTFRIWVEADAWGAAAPGTTGPVGAGEAAQVEVAVRIPPGAWGDARSALTVVAASTIDPSQEARAQVVSVAARRYGLSLGPGASAQVGAPGASVRYTLQLTNTGNITDSVALSLGEHGWSALVPVVLRGLAPGASASFTVTVAIPPGAAPGAADALTVRASSQGGAAVATARLVTRTPAQAPGFRALLPLVRR